MTTTTATSTTTTIATTAFAATTTSTATTTTAATVLYELDGASPAGLLDTHIAMIPKSDGDATSRGQRPRCVHPGVHRL